MSTLIRKTLEDPVESDLARSILHTDRPDLVVEKLNELVAALLGWDNYSCFHYELSVGAAIGVTGPDGQRCLIKVTSPDVEESELRSRIAFQSWLVGRQFPCPAVLTAPTRVGDLLAHAEVYLDQGRRADGHLPLDRTTMATGLATICALSRDYPDRDAIPEDTLVLLKDSPWPKPHNVLFDFEATRQGAEWIDAVSAAYRQTVETLSGPRVIGHMDFGAKHCRIENESLTAVYDWDSTALVPETRVVGTALTTFTTTWYVDCDNKPDVTEMCAFLRDYETARGTDFNEQEVSEIAATAYYCAGYTARCEHAIDFGTPDANTESREFLKRILDLDLNSTFANARFKDQGSGQ